MTRSVASTGAVLASCFAVAVFFLVAPATPAQEPGDPIEGVITSVDEHTVVVSSEEGREVTVRVGPRTRVFVRGRGPEAGPDFLRPGMRVRFRYDTAMLNRLHVTDLPPGVSPPEGAADEPSGREVKARLVRIDRAGALSADVAGRTERYRLKDPAMLRSFDPGDLVILTIDADTPDLVSDIRPAALSGRVVRVDRERREVIVDVNGREEAFQLDDAKLLDRLREGASVRFDVEERPGGRRSITAVY